MRIFYGDTSGRHVTWDESGDALHFEDATEIKVGTHTNGDMVLVHDGSHSYIKNRTGALKLATETSGIAVNIGHTTSETTINDNLTVTGNSQLNGTLTVTNYASTMIGSLTVGANDAGHDVNFYGDTALRKVMWDTSADELLVHGKISQRYGSAFKNQTHAGWVMGS